MATYKCISCGTIKESENDCRCSECGYKMYVSPYDRPELLKREIRDFIICLKLNQVKNDALKIYRKVSHGKDKETGEEIFEIIPKSKDDQRFPDFAKIQDYVCSAQKTEIFYERLNTTLEQIRKHVHTPYKQSYIVALDSVKTEVSKLDTVLVEALTQIGITIELPEVNLPELQLAYSEVSMPELLAVVDEILDMLIVLANKIKNFIKQNNLYGTAYQKHPKRTYKYTEESDARADLQKCIDKLSKVLPKKYVVDIFSDGSDELYEMLKVLWLAIEMIMFVPVLEKKYVYTFDDGTISNGDAMTSVLLERICRRYRNVDTAIYALDFLSDKSEEELFDIYNKMIELDAYGFMGINKNSLLKIGESEKKLERLIGLTGIKESIKKIKAYALANRDSDDLNIHMCFLGNPGTGKTEVARYIAGILYENKILPTKKVVEVDRSGLVSQYFGATAEKTSRVIDSAMGGVLFVDEAYALGNNSDVGITDYGKEAIDTLVKAMEDHRGKLCVILAGYKNEMLKMLDVNPGFKSRIQFMLDFPNYSREELQRITQLMLSHRKYSIMEPAMNRILDITDIKRKDPNFANAREIRNILDQVIMCQNLRCAGSDVKSIGLVDVNKYIQDAKINLPTSGDGMQKKVLSGEEELDQLIGLASVKRMVRKIKAYAKRNKGSEGFNLHMCFYGNPGTGKTEVARILSRILHDAEVLDEAKLVETDAHGLLGRYVGETGPKTANKINDAMGGVLFIDEAYGLIGGNSAGGGTTNYGEEAIAVLLKEMEDRRGQFCVILAGYKNEMHTLLNANPGFESRLQFSLDFPDYSREELGAIAQVFLAKKKYTIETTAMERLLDITEYYRKQPNFANARTLRNIIDQVLMNQNLRTEDFVDDRSIILSDVEDYLSDEEIDLSSTFSRKGSIGFLQY